jgi:DNA-binding NtrC family response regulator
VAAPPRTLIVDDEHAVRLTYSLILERHGHKVTVASSASEAKAALDRDQFDLLLCDLSLEERHTGLDVIRFARQRQPGVPAILITGYATEDVLQLAGAQSIDSVLLKPVAIAEFLETIARLLREGHVETQNQGRAKKNRAANGPSAVGVERPSG